MKPLDLAKLFLRKADQDIALLAKVLPDNDVADEIVGFHCQQAAEKILKAVLAKFQIDFRKTHDLAELIDMLSDHGHPIPDHLSDLESLTPFAVEFRYDIFDQSGSEFNRMSAMRLVNELRDWAENAIESGML